MSLWIPVCHYRSHKDIRDVTDDLTTQKMICKLLNIFHIRKPGAIQRTILGCVTGVLNITVSVDIHFIHRLFCEKKRTNFAVNDQHDHITDICPLDRMY